MSKKENRREFSDAPTKIPSASALKRATSFIIDLLFMGLLIFISMQVFEIQRFLPGDLNTKLIGLGAYFYFLLTLLPHIFFAQTIGKYNNGIKVVTPKLERVGIATFFIRDVVLRPVVIIAPFTALNLDGQALHDKILGTVVLEAKYRLKSPWWKDLLFYFYHFMVLTVTLVAMICIREPKSMTDQQLFLSELNKLIPKTELLFGTHKLKGAEDIEDPITKITNINGKVQVSYPWAKAKAPADGEEIRPQGTLVTQEKSSALVSFKDKYAWQMRLSPESEITNSVMMEKNLVTGELELIYTLKKGVASFSFSTNDKKMPLTMKVITAHAAFVVKGTKFAVLTDESNTVLVIEHGKIEVENFKNQKKQIAESGATYVTDHDGNDKLVQDATPLLLFNWELEHPEEELLVPETILKLPAFQETKIIEEVKVEDPIAKLKAQIDEEISNFKMKHEGMVGELDALKESHLKLKEEVTLEVPAIQQDISCLRSKRGNCNLFSEQILVSRGFPNTKGTPQYRKSMAKDLEAYLKERKQSVPAEKTKIENHEEILKKRAEVLKVVEEKRAQGAELESLVPMLKDETLLWDH